MARDLEQRIAALEAVLGVGVGSGPGEFRLLVPVPCVTVEEWTALVAEQPPFELESETDRKSILAKSASARARRPWRGFDGYRWWPAKAPEE